MAFAPPGPVNAADPRLTDESLMKRFAAEQLRQPGSDIGIAMKLLNEPNLALIAVNQWNEHPIVIDERLRLQNEHGQRAELPSKETMMLEVLAIGRNDRNAVRDRLSAYSLYAELNNYTGRNSGQAPAVNLFANKVMMVKDHGGLDAWERAATGQQSGLIKQAQENERRNSTTH